MLERYRGTPLKAMVERSKIRCPKLSLSGEGTSQAMIDNCNSSLFDSLIKTLLNWSRGRQGCSKLFLGDTGALLHSFESCMGRLWSCLTGTRALKAMSAKLWSAGQYRVHPNLRMIDSEVY